MKNVTMISRRSFLKAAMAASAVSALAFTGCGGSASSTVAASSTASSAAASAAAEGGQTFKVGIVNYVDHASLNQIVESVESRLDELGAEKGVTFDYADYYANAQADQSNLNQIGADLVGDGVDVIVAVATPTAATMLAAVEDTDIPVVYSAVTDPAAAGFDGEENITGTSDALNTEAIMKLITAVNPDIDTIGLLYDLSQDASTQAIADAKAFCDTNGIKYIEKNGTTTAEVQMAAEALIAAGVKAHVIIVEDNQQVVGRGRSIVQALESQSSAHAAVANDGYYVAVFFSFLGCCDSHTQSRRNRIGGMSAGKGVVIAFYGSGKRTYAFEFAVGAESLATSGEHLVPVSLMPHIPYDAVVWSVVDVMQRYGQFHRTQTRSKMSRIA